MPDVKLVVIYPRPKDNEAAVCRKRERPGRKRDPDPKIYVVRDLRNAE